MIESTVIADAVKNLPVGDSAVIAGQDVTRRSKRVYLIAGESLAGVDAAARLQVIADAAARHGSKPAPAGDSAVIAGYTLIESQAGHGLYRAAADPAQGMYRCCDGNQSPTSYSAAAKMYRKVVSSLPAAVIESPAPQDVPAPPAADLPAESADDGDSQAAYDQAAAAFAARRLDLPAGDVIESAALADPALRTLTPALLAAAAADPACGVTGIPCMVSIGKYMVPARIIGAESRADARLADKYGDDLYPGVMMIRESNGADVWHKISRRTVMIAESLAAQYDSSKPARPARPAAAQGNQTQAAKGASKADAGLARLNAQAAKAQAALQAAQATAAAAAAALQAAQAAATPSAPARSIILPGSDLPAPQAILIARR